ERGRLLGFWRLQKVRESAHVRQILEPVDELEQALLFPGWDEGPDQIVDFCLQLLVGNRVLGCAGGGVDPFRELAADGKADGNFGLVLLELGVDGDAPSPPKVDRLRALDRRVAELTRPGLTFEQRDGGAVEDAELAFEADLRLAFAGELEDQGVDTGA